MFNISPYDPADTEPTTPHAELRLGQLVQDKATKDGQCANCLLKRKVRSIGVFIPPKGVHWIGLVCSVDCAIGEYQRQGVPPIRVKKANWVGLEEARADFAKPPGTKLRPIVPDDQ